MDVAKDVLAKPVVTEYLKWEYWPYYLAAFLVLALVLVLVFLVVRRRSHAFSDKLGLRKHLPEGLLKQEEQIPRSSLRKVWKAFLAQIPRQFRVAIQTYRPYVVLGESGTGKSLLIDNYTDWRGQANRFYPSYTVDPLLQIYLGSRALAMEIPPSLLNNTTRQARSALLALWKPIFEHRDATVIVVLNAPSLLQELPENIRRSAEMMRGKINILASVQKKKPVRVHLVLSHMDQIVGYDAFADFMAAEDIPLEIDLEPEDGVQRIADGLEPYETILPRILTSKSADDYLSILSFFRETPEIFRILASFAKILKSADPLSPSPYVARVSLVSREGKGAPRSGPFLQESAEDIPTRTVPNLRHRYAALTCLIVGALYLGGVYTGERTSVSKYDTTLHLVDATPIEQYNEYAHTIITKLVREIRENPIFYLWPRFFTEAEAHLSRHYARQVRKHYLDPCWMNIRKREDAAEGAVYLLGLRLSTRYNDLGKLVLANAEEWHKTLDLPTTLVTDYVRNNLSTEEAVEDLRTIPKEHLTWEMPDESALPWAIFFNKVKKACSEPSINKDYYHSLQKEAETFRKVVDRVARFRLTNEIVALLRRDTPIGDRIKWIQKRDITLEQPGLREILYKIKGQDLVYPSAAETGLAQFIESVKTMVKLSGHEEVKEYRFSYGGEAFSLNSSDWDNMLLRSRITLFMREFMAQNKRVDGMLFFGKSSSIGYPDLVMNPSNDGLLYFVGKGKVDGKFTRSAFEQQVKPVLSELPGLLQTLPVAEDEKRRFSQFVQKQAEAYADRYVAVYRAYYSQFRLSADSLGGLKYILKQIQLPSSPLQDFLSTMKENTVLDVGESPLMRQFSKKLGTFDFIRRLMLEKDGAFPEFEKYKAMLKQMDDDLESNEPFASANKADDANELKRILSPVGRISLSIQRSEAESYSSLVRKWLKSVGIDSEWQQPFLDPVSIAFFLGRNDVETSVAKVWSDLSDSFIKPLYSKFPFNRQTEVEISPSELEKIAHPQGAFWKTFKDYLAPVCSESAGFWSERVSPVGAFRIPEGMLNSVNEMSRLASSLWNGKGAPQPIVLQIRPLKLPPRTEHLPIAVLSYLRSDKSSVFAFNQQPAWQKIEVEWWKSQTSAVGVEFEAYKDSVKSYQEITISERFWSFFLLLSRAEIVDKSLLVWRVGGPAQSPQAVKVGFTMQSDPWAVFTLNQ
ncbi:MAG: hypothetical protein LLG06_13550 [Desulfobacteraceae bacterium]|nr:hypothetical protein [Desulfobacteraceae bacterium]